MYHTHLHDEEQLPGGLYGPLIVLEPGTKFDSEHDHIALFSRAGPGPIDGALLLNGSLEPPTLHWRIGSSTVCDSSTSPHSMAVLSRCGRGSAAPPVACTREGRCRSATGASSDAGGAPAWLPGEVYDFEYKPTVAGVLQLEFSIGMLKMKVTQQIEVR